MHPDHLPVIRLGRRARTPDVPRSPARRRWLGPTLVVGALVLATGACSSSDDGDGASSDTVEPAAGTTAGSRGTTTPETTAAPGTTATTAGAPGATGVTIEGFAFSPDVLTVPAGATVTFTNADRVTHTATAGAPGSPTGAFDLQLTGGGTASGSITAGAPGSYPYFCRIHESMRGELVVTG